MCSLRGHAYAVTNVQFSDDGTQVISGSTDDTVRFWDVASGDELRQVEGKQFAFVEGASDKHNSRNHVLTASGDVLLVHDAVHPGQNVGEKKAAIVACFKAPQPIRSVRCHGAAIFVGCSGGAVQMLHAPFLAV